MESRDTRQQRLAQALRENLKKRKAQAQSRELADSPASFLPSPGGIDTESQDK
jgi:hypothetical protein